MTAVLDEIVDLAVSAGKIAGAAILVAREGRIVFRRCAGFLDREAGTAMPEDAVFRLSSLTKPITSAAAMVLVERGLLALNDPVIRWIPAFRPKLSDGSEPEITIHHLLTHTAGLSYGFNAPPGGPYWQADISDGLAHPGRSLEDNLCRIVSVPLLFEPGTQWHYSVATDVLGAVIAAVTGLSLPEVVESLVTGPLAMSETSFFPPADLSRLAAPYVDGEPMPRRMEDPHMVPFPPGVIQFSPSRLFDPDSFPSGGAGMVGTIDDFFVLLEELRRGGGRILSRSTVELMTANQIGPLEARDPGTGFGYGFFVLKDPAAAASPLSPGSFRWGGVYGHSWFVDPPRGLTAIALTNTAVEGTTGAFVSSFREAVAAL